MIMNDEQLEEVYQNDEALSALKERWFKLAKVENYPKNKQITKKLDDLEKTIESRKKELLDENT